MRRRSVVPVAIFILALTATSAAIATVIAPPFDEASTYGFCNPTPRCSTVHSVDRSSGAFTLRSQITSSGGGRRINQGGGGAGAQLRSSIVVPRPSGRVDITVRIRLLQVKASVTGARKHVASADSNVSVFASNDGCLANESCRASTSRTVIGQSNQDLVLPLMLRDTFDRDLPAGTVSVWIGGTVSSSLSSGDSGRAIAAMRVSSTSVEVQAQPPARHEVFSLRVLANTPTANLAGRGLCAMIGDIGFGSACFTPPAGASVVATRFASDTPTTVAMRVRMRDMSGRILADTTSACGASPFFQRLLYTTMTVIVEPIARSDCAAPPESGVMTADFTIPPP